VISRLIALIKAKLTGGIAKLETPEILAEQAQEQMESSIKKTQDAVVTSASNEKMLEQQIKKCQEELATWEKRAGVAVQQNNDDVARQCLLKKQELTQNLALLNTQLAEAKTNTANLKHQYQTINEQYQDFLRKKNDLTTRAKASDALAKATNTLAKGPTGTDGIEQKIAEKEFRAAAEREVGRDPTKDQLKALDEKAGIDDELAALKAQMQPPKLIVDQESPKEE
jgi:phage shock protein A